VAEVLLDPRGAPFGLSMQRDGATQGSRCGQVRHGPQSLQVQRQLASRVARGHGH
jgi:hypothetical protein